MTPQELKNSIVQSAMRGRLVEQRTEEGSAEELYSLIQAEKKSKGIYDNKKMEPITEDIIPYDVPDNWCWVRFGDIVGYNMGKTPPRAEAEWWKPEYPWVSIADMPENGHITSTKECVSMSAINKKFGNKVTQAGTMIMSFKLTVGRVSILDIDAVHNEAIISIYPFYDADMTIQSYLFKLLPTVAQYGDTKNAIKGKTLNSTSICNLLIPLPPLAEQKRIVAKIEELLPYIDRYEQAWSKLEDFNRRFPTDMQKSILQMAIQGKLVEQRPKEGTGEELYQQIQVEKQRLIKEGSIKKEKPLPEIAEDEKPFDIPESWKWVRLGDLLSVRGGKRLPIGSNLTTTETKHVYIRVTDMQRNTVDMTDLHYITDDVYNRIRNYIITKNDLYIVIVGSTIGKVGSIPEQLDGMNLTENAARLTPFLIDKDYLLRTLQTEFLQNQFIDKTHQVGQPKLALMRLKTAVVPLPPLAEQKRIVSKLEEILPLCEKLK
jgi:type I restriction enzyme S subunit